MPEIDMSDVILDPGIAGERFSVIRRTNTVDQHGRPVIAEAAAVDAWGSIGPTGDNSLVRADAYETQNQTITVITTFMLRGISKGGATEYQPDLIVWPYGGTDRYEVRSVNNYSRYGAGFIEAECSSWNFNNAPPAGS